LLEAIDLWGIEKVIGMLNGMFAFALWDCRERALHLVRDRVGIKPLLFMVADEGIVFGSELRALLQHPIVPRHLDRGSVDRLLRFGFVPGPSSIISDVEHVPPGGHLIIRDGQWANPERKKYWHGPSAKTPTSTSSANVVEGLKGALVESVSDCLVADVPVSVFLSSGIVSSLVAAIAASQGGSVNTFSIGFENKAFDEAPIAARIASHLGTNHTEIYVEEQDALNVVPRLSSIFDEPFADSSQIPTVLVSRAARQHVTVCLSGDGADELFGGYRRYTLLSSPLVRAYMRLPATPCGAGWPFSLGAGLAR
jgi:asparagine synthase (glutamine-hydrolysing)